MSVDFDVQYVEPRNRLTVAFRLILAIPHLIFVGVWSYAVQLVSVVQWFIILFSGERNEGIFRFQRQWLGYASRVNSYETLLHDTWPTSAASGATSRCISDSTTNGPPTGSPTPCA